MGGLTGVSIETMGTGDWKRRLPGGWQRGEAGAGGDACVRLLVSGGRGGLESPRSCVAG